MKKSFPFLVTLSVVFFVLGILVGGYGMYRATDQFLAPAWWESIALDTKNDALALKYMNNNDNETAKKLLCNGIKVWPSTYQGFNSNLSNGLFPKSTVEGITEIKAQLESIQEANEIIEKSAKYCGI